MISAGSRMLGSVTAVERAGRMCGSDINHIVRSDW